MGDRASGNVAAAALRAAGIDHLFTLSGAHIFPLYEGCRDEGVTLVDTRHEQAAGFAAEGLAKLTRRPQAAAVTAGPGVTNALSAMATAQFSGSPLTVLAGRAPVGTWGRGSLQEMDHCALVDSLTKSARTADDPSTVPAEVAASLTEAATPHRGPTFLDIPLDVIFSAGGDAAPTLGEPAAPAPDDGALDEAVAALAASSRPVLLVGTDAWYAGAWDELRHLAETVRVPVIMNGMGRGLLPADHDLAFSRARGAALKGADLVVVAGTPLDFRLGFGVFGDAEVVHLQDHPDQVAGHVDLRAGVGGDLAATFAALAERVGAPSGGLAEERAGWVASLDVEERAKRDEEVELLTSGDVPIHPARVYGALREVLDRDAIVIGDGGDFVSYAGRLIDSHQPGCWLDPGPFGCLGTGLGYAIAARIAHPDRQVVLLLGDGAAGFGLMEADTLARHGLDVSIICGNNGIWALEKHPMRMLYDGWDVAADLDQGTRYDEVVRALGGGGETVERPEGLREAIERSLAADGPYLVNVLTDPEVAYPRRTVLA